MSDIGLIECGSCGAQAWGYPWQELVEEGWERKHSRTSFYLCPACVRRFAETRRLNRLLKLESAQDDRLAPR